MNARNNYNVCEPGSARAFTFVDLLAVIGVAVLCIIFVLPGMARTKTNSSLSQCQNNLRQLASAWAMYPTDNMGVLVSAYPTYAGFTATWCGGNAATGGGAGSYVYGGAQAQGITNGLLWPYIKSLSPYKCPADNRVSQPGNPLPGQVILRSVSMNSYMAGTSFGANPDFIITSPSGSRDPSKPVFLKENEISRPASIFVVIDQDPQSINDGMFLVDMGGSRKFIELPSRLHDNGYTINFADGHTEDIKLRDQASLTWIASQPGGINDWKFLTNITTAPLN